MAQRPMRDLIAAHPVFRDFDESTLDLLAGCARNEHFSAGASIFQEDDPVDRLYILREGDVAIEIATPERAPLVVETLHAGDLVGWSCMVPPHRAISDARAVSDVRATSLDAACVRGKCDDNPVLGYRMFQHWMPHLARRMQAMRLQLADLYGRPGTV